MIDKNKAYRFRDDSERWEFYATVPMWMTKSGGSMNPWTFNHLHERGILLEYPELPGEDWEFCEAEIGAHRWCDVDVEWHELWCGCDDPRPIYCRKKKPVITEVEVVVESHWAAGDRIYLPSGFAGPGDKVKVTKL